MYKDFGEKIREFRFKTGQSISQVAIELGVDRSYLSKLEHGYERPSIEILNRLTRYYSLSIIETNTTFYLAGYRGGSVVLVKNREEIMADSQNVQAQAGMQVKINEATPVFYSDSVYLTTNPMGIILDFAVSMGPTNQLNVFSRIGMSIEHAKALYEVLGKHLVQAQTTNQKNKN